MSPPDRATELLKIVLDNLSKPERLDDHPWTKTLIVGPEGVRDTHSHLCNPGTQLTGTISRIFTRLKPAQPPKRSLRLDTRWGEFGLLAARYFAPYKFGLPYPASLSQARNRIDEAIQLFVFNGQADIPESERERYVLLGKDTEFVSRSTISDWHRKAIECLAELVVREEDRLINLQSNLIQQEESVLSSSSAGASHWKSSILWSWIGRTLALILMAFIFLGGWKAWRIYQVLRAVEDQTQALQSFSVTSLEPGQINETSAHLSTLRFEMQKLKTEITPVIFLTPYLGWLPVYGGDLSQASQLVELGLQMSIAGDEAFNAAKPVLPLVLGKENSPPWLDVLAGLEDVDVQLLAAGAALGRARTARQQIDADKLSDKLQMLVLEKIDPLLAALEDSFPVDDVLLMARLTPRLLGAAGSGPQTYLVLLQNEDELRPTGGFLTAVGLLELEAGRIQRLKFEDSFLADDLTRPYPKAPWQLDQYMRAGILLLRDANWFTDFPTSVEWVKFLYGYSNPEQIDGVIALDQHTVVEILRILGPIDIEGGTISITADNVLGYMRTAEEPVPEGVDRRDWDRKRFIGRLAVPLVEKLTGGEGFSTKEIFRKLIELLDQKHILLQSEDPEIQDLLARRGWDGGVLPSEGQDFLMVVDTNIGFNKTNAVLNTSVLYELNLSDPAHPRATLQVTLDNHSSGDLLCYQNQYASGTWSELYNIDDCYWSYLRVYLPAGSKLSFSDPHPVPAGWTLREEPVPAHVDDLGNEGLPGVQAYGTLVVVPAGDSLRTTFVLALPSTVVVEASGSRNWSYQLEVQKQPGTLARPFSLRVIPPTGFELVDASPAFERQDSVWTAETDMRTDQKFQFVIKPYE